LNDFHPNHQKPDFSKNNSSDGMWNEMFHEFLTKTGMTEDECFDQFYSFYRKQRFIKEEKALYYSVQPEVPKFIKHEP
jgi:hypothetical protein